jgi:hypothetical protein
MTVGGIFMGIPGISICVVTSHSPSRMASAARDTAGTNNTANAANRTFLTVFPPYFWVIVFKQNLPGKTTALLRISQDPPGSGVLVTTGVSAEMRRL